MRKKRRGKAKQTNQKHPKKPESDTPKEKKTTQSEKENALGATEEEEP